jgi:hypothetical protein
MFTSPGRSAFPIFTNDDTKPYTGATIAVLTTLAQLQHAVTQLVAHYARSWRWSNCDRGSLRRRTVLRRHHDPRSVAALLVASLLVVTVAAWPWLPLRGNGSARGSADNCADCGPAPAVQCSA